MRKLWIAAWNWQCNHTKCRFINVETAEVCSVIGLLMHLIEGDEYNRMRNWITLKAYDAAQGF